MITVTISVNGAPLLTRSARNTGKVDAHGRALYIVDDGKTIRHHRMDGAAVLGIKMLDQVHNIDAELPEREEPVDV